MRVEQINYIQQLKKNLPSIAKKEFAQLERDLLDAFHCQRLYPDNELFSSQEDDILQQLNTLPQNNAYKEPVRSYLTPTATQSASISPTSDNSSFFPNVLSKQSDLSASFPTCTVKLLTNCVPISYCYHHNEKTYPLITLQFDNRHLARECVANISVTFHEYSDPIRCQITIPAGSQLTIPFLPLIRTKYMREITEQCHVTLDIGIEYLSPFPWRQPYTQVVDFLSRNTALLWRCGDDGKWIDCTPYLAAWVTPHHAEIKKIASQAAHMFSTTGMWGYSVSGSKTERTLAVREQAKAIFTVLHRAGLVYVNSSRKIQAGFDHTVQKMQFIRLPEETLKYGGAANCIDGAVLFASILEHVNLHPVLLLLSGHALVGWRVFKDDESTCEFLETTKIHESDFHNAWQAGQAQYRLARRRRLVGKSNVSSSDYAFLVDIAECRANNIQPIDW